MSTRELVLITGGCGGLGLALAEAFLDSGRRVVAADVPGRTVPARLRGQIEVFAVDAADEAAVRALVARVEQAHGAPGTVVANAGVPGGGGLGEDDAWAQCWAVNVMSHVFLARAVVPGMIARGGGRFVSVASAAGLLTNLGNAPYSVTKHAAVAFAEWLAITYGDQGLDVRLVAPMGIETPMLAAGAGTLEGESVRALGVIEAAEAARRIMAGLESDEFLILTHPEVARFEQVRAADRDAWLHGMRRQQAAILRRLRAQPAAPDGSA